MSTQATIMAIIGLGNPGSRYSTTRHNIGFCVVDLLAARHGGIWHTNQHAQEAKITFHDRPLLLVKPQTFMNSSGDVLPSLQKRGIKPENILVVHDELEKPFGAVSYRFGGSARGHNGLRSLIQAGGPDFGRIRCGIGRPEHKEEVPNYVLQPFSQPQEAIQTMFEQTADLIERMV